MAQDSRARSHRSYSGSSCAGTTDLGKAEIQALKEIILTAEREGRQEVDAQALRLRLSLP